MYKPFAYLAMYTEARRCISLKWIILGISNVQAIVSCTVPHSCIFGVSSYLWIFYSGHIFSGHISGLCIVTFLVTFLDFLVTFFFLSTVKSGRSVYIGANIWCAVMICTYVSVSSNGWTLTCLSFWHLTCASHLCYPSELLVAWTP